MNHRTLVASALTIATFAVPAAALAKPVGNEPPPKSPPVPTIPITKIPVEFPPILVQLPDPAMPAAPSGPSTPADTPVDQPTAVPVDVTVPAADPGPTSVAAPDRTAPVLSKLKIRGRIASFSLSEASTITVAVQRTGHGTAASTRTIKGQQGSGTVTIAKLKAGRYRLRLTPRDAAGNAGRTVTGAFTIR